MFRFAGVSARRRSIAVAQGLYWHQIYGSMGNSDARYVCYAVFWFIYLFVFICIYLLIFFICLFFLDFFFFLLPFSFVSTGAQVPAQSISVLCHDMIGGRTGVGVRYGCTYRFSTRSKPRPRLVPSTARPSFLSDQHSPDHSSRPTAAACPN